MKNWISFFLIFIFLASFTASAQSIAPDTMNYRGKRTVLEAKEFFFVEKTKLIQDERAEILSIFFSNQINPSTLKREYFVVNGRPLPEKAALRSSKSARSVHIFLPKDFEINSLEIHGIESYDGKKVLKYSSGKIEKLEEQP